MRQQRSGQDSYVLSIRFHSACDPGSRFAQIRDRIQTELWSGPANLRPIFLRQIDAVRAFAPLSHSEESHGGARQAKDERQCSREQTSVVSCPHARETDIGE
jgi:hypothetical protein